MSRVLLASAAIALGISLTPGVALAASGRHSTPHSDGSAKTHNRTGSQATLLALGAGYGLKHGSPAVRSVQRQLVAQGFSPGPVDGRYGPLTAAAVRRFQQARGLAADGVVGSATQRMLAAGWLSEGAGFLQPLGSRAVHLLQGRLMRAGFSPGPVDGRYGPLTELAVERFQLARGLPVDGVTGTRTKAALAAGRHIARATRPKRPLRAHGSKPHRAARHTTQRKASPGGGGRVPARAPAARRGGHQSMFTALAAVVLGCLGIAVLLGAVPRLKIHRRRKVAVAADLGALPPAGAAPSVENVAEPESDRESEEEIPATEAAVVEPEPAAVERESAEPEGPAVEREPAEPEGPAVERKPERPSLDPARAHRVMTLQRQLAALGFDPGAVDGRFGPRTTAAVKRLQKMSGLEPDGIVGPLTADVLRRSAPEPPGDDRAQRVQALQRQLDWLGFEPGPADGRYGPLTTGAVKRFQEANDLPADGIVDRATSDALRTSFAQRPSSDRIDRVKALQRQLLWLGLEPGAIDGRYGPQTAEAVKRFQEENDLPADGTVGAATQRVLEQSVRRAAQW